MGRFAVPSAVLCVPLFFICELIIGFWIAYYIICPSCWPFSSLISKSSELDTLCLQPPCVPKCCPLDKAFDVANDSIYVDCFPSSDAISLDTVPLWRNGYMTNASSQTNYTVVYYNVCHYNYYSIDNSSGDVYGLLENGNLYMVSSHKTVQVLDRHEFCIESFVNGKPEVYGCFTKPAEEISTQERDAFLVGMGISLPFLVLTLIVYLLLPQLRNLHGKCLTCHVISLSTAYLFLIFTQNDIFGMVSEDPPVFCIFCAFVVQFSFLATFFWLNVMCFDIWWVFSGLRPLQGSMKEREHKKFIFYSLYAWGCPLLILTITICVELIPTIPDTFIKPHFGVEKCWFKDADSLVLYFYLPIGILVLLNIVMFVTTAFRLQVHTRETKVLKSSESRRNDNADRQRFNLYLKLFIVMGATAGINWVMELVSFAVTGPKSIWFVTDISNTLQGLLIFLIFVWKRRILRLLNQKLCPKSGT